MLRVYICGPYTRGDVAVNVANAMEAGERLISAGFAPFIPHLYHFQHMSFPHDYEVWMGIDFEWLRASDALLRIPGDSPGADREVDFAHKLGIPVFKTWGELFDWAKAKAA